MAETEGYYQMLQEHIQSLTQSLSATEEASQIRHTARTMLEALRQCIDIMKNIQVRNDFCGVYPRTQAPGNEGMSRDAEMKFGMSESFSLSLRPSMTVKVFSLYQTGWQRRRRSGRWEGTPQTPKGINQEETSQACVADVLLYLLQFR